MYLKVVLLIAFALFMTGCSSSSDVSESPHTKTTADINWLNSCEADYQSTDCNNSILKMVQQYQDVGLYVEMEPYTDPEKSAYCLEDPKGSECRATKLVSNNQMTDLTCESVEAFGFGFFCYAKLILWNKGNEPIDDYFKASIYDNEGREFAADVNGNFVFGIMNTEYSDSFKIDLNPGKFEFVHFGFSIPDIDTLFTKLSVMGYETSFDMPLCLKTRGDESNYDKSKMRFFENARLLNSCSTNWSIDELYSYKSRPST